MQGYEPRSLTHQRKLQGTEKQGTMNRAHQLINGIADSGKANQRGTHRREEKQGTMNRAHQLINGIAGNEKKNR